MKRIIAYLLLLSTIACSKNAIIEPENYFKLDNKVFNLKNGFSWRIYNARGNQANIRLTNQEEEDFDKPHPNTDSYIYVDITFYDNKNDIVDNIPVDGPINETLSVGLNKEIEILFFTKGGKHNFISQGEITINGPNIKNLTIILNGATSKGEKINAKYSGTLKHLDY